MGTEDITGEVVPGSEENGQYHVIIRRSGRIITDLLVCTALDAKAALEAMIAAIRQARAQVG